MGHGNDPFLYELKERLPKLFTKSNWNLLAELSRANLKVRDHNSVLGVFWSLLGPGIMLLVMYLIFRTRFGQEIEAYPLYLLLGIVLVGFFITSTTYLLRILSDKRDLLLNSTGSRESFILSNFFVHGYKFVIEMFICWVVSLLLGLSGRGSFLFLFPLLISYLAFVLGTGLIISLLYCFMRDIEHLWLIASRLFFFATPIFYNLDNISPLGRKLIYWGNPLTPFIISFREIIMGAGTVSMPTYLHSLLLGGLSFILSYFIFIKYEKTAVERG